METGIIYEPIGFYLYIIYSGLHGGIVDIIGAGNEYYGTYLSLEYARFACNRRGYWFMAYGTYDFGEPYGYSHYFYLDRRYPFVPF